MRKHSKKPTEKVSGYVGIDLGDKKSRVCTLGEQGQVVAQEWSSVKSRCNSSPRCSMGDSSLGSARTKCASIHGLLVLGWRLISGFCSSTRAFAPRFFQTLPRGRALALKPAVLTVNGQAEVVIQSAEAYQKLLDDQQFLDSIRGIGRGLEQAKRGEGRSMRALLEELAGKRGR
jgi:hypothetical protein